MMEVFWFIWVIALPVLAILLLSAIPLVWFVIVPKPARILTWARFRNWVLAFIQDDSGNVELLRSDQMLPEGVVHNEKGWFFLPRPRFKGKKEEPDELAVILEKFKQGEISGKECDEAILAYHKKKKRRKEDNPDSEKVEEEKVEKMILQPTILRGLGKQVFFGYSGTALLNNLKTFAHVDLRKVKEVLPHTLQRSQFHALAVFCRTEGMEMRGKEYGKLILGGAIIIGLVIIAIVAMAFLLNPSSSAAIIESASTPLHV